MELIESSYIFMLKTIISIIVFLWVIKLYSKWSSKIKEKLSNSDRRIWLEEEIFDDDDYDNI